MHIVIKMCTAFSFAAAAIYECIEHILCWF